MTDPITTAAQALLGALFREWPTIEATRIGPEFKALREALGTQTTDEVLSEDRPDPAEIIATFLLEGALRGGETEARMQYKARRMLAALWPVMSAEFDRHQQARLPTTDEVLWEGPLGMLSRAWQGYGNGESDRPEDRVRVVRATDQPSEARDHA